MSTDLICDLNNYGAATNVELRTTSPDWILTQVGSRLTANISASATTIPVADVTQFAANELVVLEGELLRSSRSARLASPS